MSCATCQGRGWVQPSPDSFPSICPCTPPVGEPANATEVAPEAELAIVDDETSPEYLVKAAPKRPQPAWFVDFTGSDGARWCAGASSREEAERIGTRAVASFARGGDRLGLGFDLPPEEVTYAIRRGRGSDGSDS